MFILATTDALVLYCGLMDATKSLNESLYKHLATGADLMKLL